MVRLILPFIMLWQANALLYAQNVGINANLPEAPLHVIRNTSSSGPKTNNALNILESNEESYIQLSHPENVTTGILSGDRHTSIRSSLIFQGDSSMLFKTGGNYSRMILNNKGRLGINTLFPVAQLHVQDSSVVFTGPSTIPANPGPPPVSGPGSRMMWYSDKASIRIGTVYDNLWDKENVGLNSVGMGYHVMAKGYNSIAIGSISESTGTSAVAMGFASKAKGDLSTAHSRTFAKSYNSFVIGAMNDTSCIATNYWNLNDPLFIIGNGTDDNARNNAMTVLKNGKTGINVKNPSSMLHVLRTSTSGGPQIANAIATFESNTTSFLHLTHPSNAYTGILSGNTETSIRCGMIFDIDSAIVFRTGGNFTRMKLSKAGYLGINTFSPKSLLHIVRSGTSGGPFHANALATLESIGTGYIQFSQNNNAEAGIISGNAVTELRSGVVFGVDSSLYLRTGGNFNRLAINKLGDIGIGTITPKAKLHVKRGNSGVPFGLDATMAIFEGDGTSFIELASPAGQANGIISSDPSMSTRSAILFLPDRSIEFKSGGNGTPAMVIDENGKIGIGTTNPTTQFEVNGSFTLGSDGTSLNQISQHYLPFDLPAILSGASYTATFYVGTVGTSGTVHVSPSSDLPDGIIIAHARTTNNNIHVKFTNVTSSPINPVNTHFFLTVIQ